MPDACDGWRPTIGGFSRLPGGPVSVVILPTLLPRRRGAALACPAPRTPAPSPSSRPGRHPAAAAGGPAGRAVLPTRRPDGRDLQDRGRRQPGPAAGRAGRAGAVPARRNVRGHPPRSARTAGGDDRGRRGGVRGWAGDPGATPRRVGQPEGPV